MININIQLGKVNQSSNITHRIKTDFEIGRDDRPYLPMVFVFDDNNVILTKEWQFYLCAINYGMRLQNISHIITDSVALCNGTGVGHDTWRRNWILREDLTAKDPETDKTRTFGDAFIHLENSKVSMLDGSKAPLLKQGYTHPLTSEEALSSINRYIYNPKDNPEYFPACVSTGNDGKAHPWSNGALYPWYKNGSIPVTFFFHVAKSEVIYPPQQFTENTPQLQKV